LRWKHTPADLHLQLAKEPDLWFKLGVRVAMKGCATVQTPSWMSAHSRRR
jgi:hypothetical protein